MDSAAYDSGTVAKKPRTAEPTAKADPSVAYNRGEEADLRKAFDSIYDYNKNLIAIATGTVALSATFLGRNVYHGVDLSWLVWA